MTGGSRGIGAALAEALAARGARVSVAARNAKALDAVATRTGGTALIADLSDTATRRGLIARAESSSGPVDLLVNNAGTDRVGAVDAMTADDLEGLIARNLLAAAELTRQVLPGMLARGRGHIVNLSSLAGVASLPGLAAYGASKAALTHFTAGVRADTRGTPIRTTLVEAGFVQTAMRDEILAFPPARRAYRRLVRVGALVDTPIDRLVDATVDAVARERRHVRYPGRARGLAMTAEAPRRLIELLLGGVRARP